MIRKHIDPLTQVAELTRGHILPQTAVPAFHMQVIAGCIAQEWKALMDAYPDQFPAGEVETTTLLCNRLQNLQNELWVELVASIKPGIVVNYNGEKLEKRPDLSICLTRRHSPFCLEVECKLIDHPHRKTIELYVNEGLSRFLKGDYAWATREAFMLGYVQDGSTLANRLIPFLEQHQKSRPDPYSTNQLPLLVNEDPLLARSSHARAFSYPLQTPSSPGPIEIWHLWVTTEE